jgi:UDP-N-acetylglucosamine 2-epimerase (non-hydrolysing)
MGIKMTCKTLITVVAAARPNFMKAAPLLHEFKKQDKYEVHLVHTGQHYDYQMNERFFEQLKIPKPYIDLEVGSGSHAKQTAEVMIKFESYLIKHQPKLVIVFGDVNSTMACAITAKKCHIKVAHVESGLRSGDREMPEEINRIVTDSIADILYTTSEDANKNLLKEGADPRNIIFVGNIMIDTLFNQKKAAEELNYYASLGLNKKDYVLLTLHRPSNVDNQSTFESIIQALLRIASENTIVFPVHPRTKQRIADLGLSHHFNFNGIEENRVNVIDPIGYNEMIHLLDNCYCALTDSGGIQEESTALSIPCLTLRENTERPVTVTEGTNEIVGTSTDAIIDAYNNIPNRQTNKKRPKFWDGKTSERILSHLNSVIK